MNQREQALEWLRYAGRDLSSASFLTNQHPVPTEIICFHCQQAGEKALKALLVARNEAVPKIHDLQKLLALLLKEFPVLKTVESSCLFLTGFGSLVRYPFNLEVPEDLVPISIGHAEAVVALIRQLLSKEDHL